MSTMCSLIRYRFAGMSVTTHCVVRELRWDGRPATRENASGSPDPLDRFWFPSSLVAEATEHCSRAGAPGGVARIPFRQSNVRGSGRVSLLRISLVVSNVG
jgi:hypothetical protein